MKAVVISRKANNEYLTTGQQKLAEVDLITHTINKKRHDNRKSEIQTVNSC